jgi:hypothetical protein
MRVCYLFMKRSLKKPLIIFASIILIFAMCISCTTTSEEVTDDGAVIKEQDVFIEVNEELIKVEANPEKGFYWDYYLFIPDLSIPIDNQLFLLVKPTNTGFETKDIEVHDQEAKQDASSSWTNEIARILEVPLLVPVFPRETDKYYTHQLSRDVILIKDGDLKRIDLQLIAMIEDARELLNSKGLSIKEKNLLNGYSACGQFSNRFAILHPHLVRAVASGGLVGVPTIPASEWEGKYLHYPVGIADLEEITGIQFEIEQYREVAQYIYLGSLDDHDEVDMWADNYLGGDGQIIWDITSRDYLERFFISQQIYKELGIPAQFVTYDGVGHVITSEMLDDVVEFFRKHIDE